MIQARIDAHRELLKLKTRDELIESALYYYVESNSRAEELEFLKNTQQEFMLQFQQMKDELAGVKAENKYLLEQNRHLTGVREIQDKNLFGRSTEKRDALMRDALSDTPVSDPLSEDADCEDRSTEDSPTSGNSNNKIFSDDHNRKKKCRGKREADLSEMPRQVIYDYDINDLDNKYGKGNWRFVYWHKHQCVEVVPRFTYLKVTYTPVISCGLEHSLVTLPYDNALLPKSLVSPSLYATIATDKYNLFLPINRQISTDNRFGLPFSRQTISNWIVKLCLELLKPVYESLMEIFIPYQYQQCDETTYLVLINGKDPGSKGYMWVHRSSPFSEDHQIILYIYDNSRSADVLRSFYKDLSSHIYVSCDAYSAYPAFEKDNPENVTICGCFMHARRRFADALRILNIKNLPAEQVSALPEVKAIELIKNIYREENQLRELSAEDRLALRNEKVMPCVDEYFNFIKGLDVSDPLYSDKLKDAILYSLHQETALRQFLTDGHIPLDNGATERSVKPIALGRRNYLFSNSMQGAESTAIISSLIETAKANEADPYYYIMYLLETMPKHVRRGVPIENKESLFPWSKAFRDYQQSARTAYLASLKAPPGNEKPRTPRARDSISRQSPA